MLRQNAARVYPCFEMEVNTPAGRKWMAVSALNSCVYGRGVVVIHLLRDISTSKDLEQATHHFVGHVNSLYSGAVPGSPTASATPHMPLTAHERQVLQLLVTGLGTKEISRTLLISVATARNHIQHILEKLSAHSRSQAVVRAIREGLI